MTAGTRRSAFRLLHPPLPFGTAFDALFLDVVAWLAKRLQGSEPEQCVILTVWHDVVGNRCWLLRPVRTQPAERFSLELSKPPTLQAFPCGPLVPLAAGLAGTCPICFTPAFRLHIDLMAFTVRRPDINQ